MLDFNNGPGDNSKSGCILAHRRLFESNSNKGPSPGHSNLGQMEDTMFRSPSYGWSPGECRYLASCPGLTSIMAQWITRKVPAFWPQHLFESSWNNEPSPGHSNLGTLKITPRGGGGGTCYVGVSGDLPFSWVYFMLENSRAGYQF